MSLRTRIFTLVGGLTATALAVMLFGLSTLSDYNRMMTAYSRAYENAYMGERLNHLISNVVMESRGIYHSRTADDTHVFVQRLDSNLDEMEGLLAQWRARGTAGPEIGLDALEARTRQFIAVRRGLSRAATEQSPAAAEAMGIADRPLRIVFQNQIDTLVAATRHTLQQEQARADTYRHDRMISFFAVALMWVILAAALSLWLVSHFIMREVERARAHDVARDRLVEQLTESNTELERFAYVASHDMQEPVRMVNIYSQMVAEDYGDRLDDKGRRYLGVITGAATRMHLMIHDLLRYSRLRNDQGDEDKTVDLNDCLRKVCANLGQLIADADAQVEAATLPAVSGNPVQIQRLLENLVGNAIKYQPPGQVPVVTISAEEDNGRWRIAISDNGLGVDPAFATEIFEPFRRLHTWDQYQGTGLGLTICRRIVERHGGTITVESPAGGGARFVFTLPAVVRSAQAIPDIIAA